MNTIEALAHERWELRSRVKELEARIEAYQEQQSTDEQRISWLQAKADTAESACLKAYNIAIEDAARKAESNKIAANCGVPEAIRSLKKGPKA